MVASTFFSRQSPFGADFVTARLLQEATASRLFTPVSLDEILKARAYTAGGLLNPPASKRNDDKPLGCKRVGDSAELV